MDPLRVRLYNVRFGDAILIIVPDAENGVARTRYILIDVGNALNKDGGKDFVFKPIIEHIAATLGGDDIDLYVMTHEHMDHVQGLFYGEEKQGVARLPVRRSWLTASSAPNYYEQDWPTVDTDGHELKTPKQHFAQAEQALKEMLTYAEARRLAGAPLAQGLQALLLNNNPRRSADCVDYLRGLAMEPPEFVHRETNGGDLTDLHPFEEAELKLWAPEENTAVYYGHFRPMALGVTGAAEGGPVDEGTAEGGTAPQGGQAEGGDSAEGGGTAEGGGVPEGGNGQAPPRVTMPRPPAGVDAGAFYRLVEARRNNLIDNLLTIDEARNNSSIVLQLNWRGWRLLFPGDAEVRSWKEMNKHGVLEPIHFLKISHHASHNGTPDDDLLEKILPQLPVDTRDRVAVASTFPDTYNGIPHEATLARLENRGVRTFTVFEALGDMPSDADVDEEEAAVLGYLEFSFPADGSQITVEARELTTT